MIFNLTNCTLVAAKSISGIPGGDAPLSLTVWGPGKLAYRTASGKVCFLEGGP